ncbi:MAG: translation initiation factor IF-3 [Candidatus Woykebacteria bacterium RBG_13_40_15]|uniref:Translation initiation factor IF-3 n=1 Tax=Candidatus Woykebacteria bacterium RBG_13_40_15 TaxID=1802593 RepID=A0A1G1W7V9_9BACT|nr:MAG: translation initiation factor IF-3 [Candidatus Woykebacteria bacterium RBG_13_40_15]
MNQNIRAEKVRLLEENGKQIGIIRIDEARERARNSNLDLVEVSGQADPPVVKIIDFKKFKYEEDKKERKIKQKTKEIETKEIWLSPTIDDHDLEIRMNRAKEFFEEGNRVQLTIKFAGREIVHPEIGWSILEKATSMLDGIGEKDSEPRLVGKNLVVGLKPCKKH